MKETENCHFWAGNFPEEFAETYFVETWDLEDEDAPVSAFARDQGVAYYDHDFLEYGWGKAASILDLVNGYYYSDQWCAEFTRRAVEVGLRDVNFFVFITDSEIEHPRSIQRDGYWLHYLGTIEYRI